jgi:dihydroorotate dehydrogenase electron transfer subunit
MRFISTAEIVFHAELAPNIFLLMVSAPSIAHTAMPGQFCMVALRPLDQTTDPLLKRPLSIHRVHNQSLSFLYKRIGRGTHLLSHKRPGEYIELIGPLGHGFDLSAEFNVLVGGGMGIAPLLFAAEALYKNNKRVVSILGARTSAELPQQVLMAFEQLSERLYVMTEDGSLGEKGLVTQGVVQILQREGVSTVLTCGPWPMLRAVTGLTNRFKVDCQVSLEAHMACGIGACLGCAVSAQNGGYLHVCKDGPVVNARLVHWDL